MFSALRFTLTHENIYQVNPLNYQLGIMSNNVKSGGLESIFSQTMMDLLEKVKSDTKLYHYTSPEGLFSIIKHNTIRFTDYRFLNDKTEYKYILIPLSSVIERIIDKIDIDILLGLYLFIINEIDNVTYSEYRGNIQIVLERLANNGYDSETLSEYCDYYRTVACNTSIGYSFSTSIDNDSLEMWNYYVKNGKYEGYNIGFTFDGIMDCFKDIISSNSITLAHGPVIYSRKEQESILEKIINTADINLKDEKKRQSHDWEENGKLSYIQTQLGQIIGFCPFFKDSHFENEQEYRFFLEINYLDEKSKNIITESHFLKNGLIIPCCDVTINKKNTIKTITISPIMEKMIAKIGVRSLLNQYKYKYYIEINQSTVPIRY